MGKNTGIVHDLVVAATNVPDVTMMPDLLTGDEEVVYGDSVMSALKAGKRHDKK